MVKSVIISEIARLGAGSVPLPPAPLNLLDAITERETLKTGNDDNDESNALR